MTLVEIMVTTVIAVAIIGSAMGVILSVGKSQLSLSNYCSMNQQSRQALEIMSRDIKLFDPNTLSITDGGHTFSGEIPHPSGTGTIVVTYTHDPLTGDLKRGTTDAGVVFESPKALIQNIEEFSLAGVNKAGTPITNLSADAKSIKQLQVNIKLSTKVLALRTRQPVISTQYTIRK